MKTNAKARSLHITPHPPLSRRQLKALPALFKDKYLEVYRQPVKTRAPLETTLNKIQSHQPHPRLWARLNKVPLKSLYYDPELGLTHRERRRP